MSYQDVKVAFATYLTAQYGAVEKITVGATTYKLIIENAPYQPPPGIPWLRWGIRPADQRAADIGSGMKRDTGLLWFQIFVPPDKGETPALLIGDELTAKFFEKDIVMGATTIKTFACNLSQVGDEGSGWIAWSAIVPYQVDST